MYFKIQFFFFKLYKAQNLPKDCCVLDPFNPYIKTLYSLPISYILLSSSELSTSSVLFFSSATVSKSKLHTRIKEYRYLVIIQIGFLALLNVFVDCASSVVCKAVTRGQRAHRTGFWDVSLDGRMRSGVVAASDTSRTISAVSFSMTLRLTVLALTDDFSVQSGLKLKNVINVSGWLKVDKKKKKLRHRGILLILRTTRVTCPTSNRRSTGSLAICSVEVGWRRLPYALAYPLLAGTYGIRHVRLQVANDQCSVRFGIMDFQTANIVDQRKKLSTPISSIITRHEEHRGSVLRLV